MDKKENKTSLKIVWTLVLLECSTLAIIETRAKVQPSTWAYSCKLKHLSRMFLATREVSKINIYLMLLLNFKNWMSSSYLNSEGQHIHEIKKTEGRK